MNEGRFAADSSPLITTPTLSPTKFQFHLKRTSPFVHQLQAIPHVTISHHPNIRDETRKTKKKRSFREEDAYPDSLPLHTRNPVAIYDDIQRFARENKVEKALTILDYLDEKGIPVNPTTFSALLAACVRSRSLSHGRQVHAHIRINNLEDNEFLCTKLVHMYTCCGSIEDAEKVFDGIPSHPNSVYAWNAVLRGNVVQGGKRYGEVLSTYSKMRELGVDMNVYSFSCLIKSFAGSSAFTQGTKAHAFLIKNGFANGSLLLQTSLIDFYFKCRKVRLARQVFEDMSERDIVVWGAMIAGFAHNKLCRDALGYLRWMRSEGIQPNSVILTSILPVIGEVRARKLGQEVHGFVIKTKSYSKQLFIQSSLIDMYCKCKDMVSGRRVFYRSMERNAITWTTLMSGYVSNGRLEQALRSITWMQQEGVKPDVVTVATVLPVCAELKALKHGKEIHGYVVKNGFLPNVSVVTSLMVMYSKCGIIDYSTKLFQGMEKRNVISWTAMIESYLKNKCLNEALAVFRLMQLSKHRPDSVAISRALSICGEVGALSLGKELHGHILKKKFESIPFVSSEIVRMYGRCGEIEKAKIAFDGNPMKGAMTWTAIIEAYGYGKRYREALDLFDELRTSGFNPNEFTFKAVLSICDQGELVDEGHQIFKSMTTRYHIKPTEEHYSSIIGLLTRSGRLDDAERLSRVRSLSI